MLVVDDDDSMRLLCRVNLELSGCEVREAADGTEALARARESGLDLILLEIMMPGIGGHDVARQLARDERTRNLPFIFLSARVDRENVRLGYELGAADFVTKPFDPLDLVTRVMQALERAECGESEQFRLARLAELGA